MTERPRRPYYERTPNGHNFQMTQRDETILLALYRHRYLNSRQLHAIIGEGSYKKMLGRLCMMFHGDGKQGYVNRPDAQKVMGNIPRIYSLGAHGIDHLRQRFHIPIENGPELLRRDSRPVGLFLQHAIDTADILIAFEKAARDRPDMNMYSASEILDRLAARVPSKGNPLAIPTEVMWTFGGRPSAANMSIVPDGLFNLVWEQAEQDKKLVHYYFLELDEGTMPVHRSNFRQSSIFKKLLGYSAIIRDRTAYQRLGIKQFRVLFVTTSWKRVQTMQTCWKSERHRLAHAQFFLFTTKDEMASENVLDGVRIEDAAGRPFVFDPLTDTKTDQAA